MKHVFALATAVFAFTACNPAPEASELITDLEQTAASQSVVNHYFFTSVTPKLRTCWSQLQGEGTVDLALRYTKSDSGWMFERVEPLTSTLPNEQVAAAQACMQEAATGSSFALEEPRGGKSFEKFVVKWRWLVPLPEEKSQEMARRLNNTDPPKGCAKCIANYPARCVWSETGKEEDCRVEAPNSCSTTGTKCLSGLYGRAGSGIIIF
ncbi:MAG TPA: hypothetical protein VJ717_09335 [Gemmatimonadaceae bacterium]|nr:hypothetical protein [Gemmatimonadaceae bacterium]